MEGDERDEDPEDGDVSEGLALGDLDAEEERNNYNAKTEMTV